MPLPITIRRGKYFYKERGDLIDGDAYKINLYNGFSSWAPILHHYAASRIICHYNLRGNLVLKYAVDYKWGDKFQNHLSYFANNNDKSKIRTWALLMRSERNC